MTTSRFTTELNETLARVERALTLARDIENSLAQVAGPDRLW